MVGFDVVVDIETLGTRPGCAIIEIGACAVGSGVEIAANFSRRVNVGLTWMHVLDTACGDGWPTVDMATAAWWTDDMERRETLGRIMAAACGSRRPAEALRDFAGWLGGIDVARIWGNGPSFDLAILAEAYRMRGMAAPWDHRKERCVRTALEQRGYSRGDVAWPEGVRRHRGLNDARHEARKLIACGAIGW